MLARCGDEVGLAAIAYHRAVLARSASLFEEGLLQLEGIVDPLGTNAGQLTSGITSERAISTFESGNVEAAMSAVEVWLTTVDEDPTTPTFNRTLPLSMRARLRLTQGDLDGATADIARAARLAADALGQHSTRTFRTSDRAKLKPLFDQALSLTLGGGRADLAVDILAWEKSIKPGRLRPLMPDLEDSSVRSIMRALADETDALVRESTFATLFHNHEAMRTLSDSAGDLLDRADTIAGHRMDHGTSASSPGAATRVMSWLLPDELVVEYVTVLGTVWAIGIRTDGVRRMLVRLQARTDDPQRRCPCRAQRARASSGAQPTGNRAAATGSEPHLRCVTRVLRLPPEPESFPLLRGRRRWAPLVTQLDVAYVPSVEFLNPQLGGRRDSSRASHVMAVSQPRYEVLDRLSSAADDAARVVAHLGAAQVSLEDDATSSAFLHALAEADLLHVTSHAAFEPSAPLLARLMLADRPGLRLRDRTRPGFRHCSQPERLQHGFAANRHGRRRPRTRCCVPQRWRVRRDRVWWPVEDEAAAAFNDAFYEQLTTSSPRADVWAATNAAQRTLLERPNWRHPGACGPVRGRGKPAAGCPMTLTIPAEPLLSPLNYGGTAPLGAELAFWSETACTVGDATFTPVEVPGWHVLRMGVTLRSLHGVSCHWLRLEVGLSIGWHPLGLPSARHDGELGLGGREFRAPVSSTAI